MKKLTRVGLACFLLTALVDGRVFDTSGWERQTWQTDNGLPQNTVHAILQSAAGYIWIATEGGLARFDGYRFQIFSTETEPAIPSNDVRALAKDRRGAVWAATAGGVVRFLGNEVKIYGLNSGLPALNVTSIYADGGGQIVAETSNGDAVWDELRFRATAGRGSSLKPGTAGRQFPEDDPLTRAGVLCQMNDREGNLWVGTETGGLTMLRRVKFSVVGQRQGLSEDSIRCVMGAGDGSVWIGTNHSGLNRWKNAALSHFGANDGLSSDVIIALGQNADGDLVVGTPDGLNIVHDTKVTVLTSADGLADDFVRSISNNGASLYVGTRRGLTEIAAGKFRTYTEKDGLGSNLVGATLTENGALWIATLHGLSRLQDGRIKNYTTSDGLTSDVITALYADREHTLWIGTQGGSLNCYRNGSIEHFAESVRLPKIIYGVAEDDGGNIWLSANTGIYRVERRSLLNNQGQAVAYGTGDGLRINEGSGGGHPALWKTPDKTLWIATPKGLATMSAEQAQLNDVPPPVIIESIRIDDNETAPERELIVGPGPTRFAFEYSGLSFVSPQKVRYRYKLEGFDRSWIEAGTRRAAFYTNVPPGDYHFRVAARNNDGVWNMDGADMRLRLKPHFYQTLWFLGICIAVAALIIYAGYRWRVSQVALRYDAVLAERNRIAREIHDTLAQGFAGISVQLELISKLMDASTESAKHHLNEARQLVRSSLNEARRSIWELRSEPGTTEDFVARLSSLTHRAPGEEASRIRLSVQGARRPLAARIEDEFMRIAQEAVRNAQHHGRAAEVNIIVTFGESLVRLSVSDNGAGFDMDQRQGAKEGHFGVEGMRERAESIGARFRIASNMGSGTAVVVEADA